MHGHLRSLLRECVKANTTNSRSTRCHAGEGNRATLNDMESNKIYNEGAEDKGSGFHLHAEHTRVLAMLSISIEELKLPILVPRIF